MRGDRASDDLHVLVGEVHTGLLQHSEALPAADCVRVLELLRGERPVAVDRPLPLATSPTVLTGVDCDLATSSGPTPRGVGSVAAYATVTGGRVLQAVAVARLARARSAHRQPWARYLATPGRVDVIGKADGPALAAGALADRSAASVLDLGAIAVRLMGAVQAAPRLDRVPPFRVARTRLRWAALVADEPGAPTVTFRVDRGQARTALVTGTGADLAEVAEFCADFALHDWLLTTLLGLLERSRIGVLPPPEVVDRLRPAVDHLLHLWMPGGRAERTAAPLWDSLERRPGLSAQWRAAVDRIRDQLALSTISLLKAGWRGSVG